MDKALVKCSPAQMSTKGDISPLPAAVIFSLIWGKLFHKADIVNYVNLAGSVTLKRLLNWFGIDFWDILLESWENSSMLAWSICGQLFHDSCL